MFWGWYFEEKSNDLGKMGLYGKVRMLTETTYELSDTSVAHAEKKYRWKHIYKFDERGNLLDHCEYDDAEDTEVTTKRVYIYDTAHRLQRELMYVRNELTGKVVYTYDKAGNAIESRKLKANDSAESKTVCKYNEQHQVVELIYYYPQGKVNRHEVYTYDKHKNKATAVIEYADSFRQRISYKYDDDRCISELSDTARRYHEAKVLHKYDKQGYEVEETSYDLDGSLHSQKKMQYKTIDKTGNWLIRIIFWKELRPTLTERVVEYYK